MKSDHRSKFSNLSNWKEEAWKKKKSGLQRDSNPWPPRYRCDALPTELWSHTLGARSIYWVHIFPCSEVMWSIYEIIHICTAVVDEVKSDHRSKFSNLSNWKEEAWKKIRASTGFEPRVTRITRVVLIFYPQSPHLSCREHPKKWGTQSHSLLTYASDIKWGMDASASSQYVFSMQKIHSKGLKHPVAVHSSIAEILKYPLGVYHFWRCHGNHK